ncbi:hypothetical protein [uncultured Campylobacter sp.]|uniref:hypothetical protein n=1 Tax=uncultured Campylobacter sp. TaxID=218934 RepID=UPI002608EF74|nr:hypothetical protein [uncultured Campylobacter sp.]
MAQKKVTRRELVKFNLPLCKIRVKFGYSTHYDYETDERGRVILINGGAASWGEVRQTALIISP